jgi:hypothetical protein
LSALTNFKRRNFSGDEFATDGIAIQFNDLRIVILIS